jgi:pilus assembly protein Flp/PilA
MAEPSLTRSTSRTILARFAADEGGATAIEYGLIAAGVAVAISATVFSFGSTLKTTFYDKIAVALK